MRWLLHVFVAVSLLSSGTFSQIPHANHVVLVVEENHSYSEVIGNPGMPFLNGLASQYGLATQYYANTHPSIGNYFMLTTGQILTNDDASSDTVSADNLVREFLVAGKSWKSYAESLPVPGYTGGDAYPYVEHHNPFSYFSDVRGTSQSANLVSFTQFNNDMVAGQLPDFSFLVPNDLNNGHDGSLEALDGWLRANLAGFLNDAAFQQNGLLIIVFDESLPNDVAGGGGHVAMVIAGPQVKSGYRSATWYQHQNTLKTIAEALGLPAAPGAAVAAADMAEFFAPQGTGSVQVSSPAAGAVVSSPVSFVASAASTLPITGMAIYVDSTNFSSSVSNQIAATVPLAAGLHSVSIQAWNSGGAIYQSSFNITVQSDIQAVSPFSSSAQANLAIENCTRH